MHARVRWIGVGILVLMLGWAGMASGDLGIFFDLPSAILVGGIVVGGLWACFGPTAVWQAVAAALGWGRPASSAREQAQRIAVMGQAYQLAWAGGILGLLIGLIAMLRNMSDPSTIGAGMAVALIATLYGAALAEMVFGPLQQVLMNQAIDAPEATLNSMPAQQRSTLGLGLAVTVAVVAIFAILVISFDAAVGDGAAVRVDPAQLEPVE